MGLTIHYSIDRAERLVERNRSGEAGILAAILPGLARGRGQ